MRLRTRSEELRIIRNSSKILLLFSVLKIRVDVLGVVLFHDQVMDSFVRHKCSSSGLVSCPQPDQFQPAVFFRAVVPASGKLKIGVSPRARW